MLHSDKVGLSFRLKVVSRVTFFLRIGRDTSKVHLSPSITHFLLKRILNYPFSALYIYIWLSFNVFLLYLGSVDVFSVLTS
jgi:hypothetical protein